MESPEGDSFEFTLNKQNTLTILILIFSIYSLVAIFVFKSSIGFIDWIFLAGSAYYLYSVLIKKKKISEHDLNFIIKCFIIYIVLAVVLSILLYLGYWQTLMNSIFAPVY